MLWFHVTSSCSLWFEMKHEGLKINGQVVCWCRHRHCKDIERPFHRRSWKLVPEACDVANILRKEIGNCPFLCASFNIAMAAISSEIIVGR